MTKRNVTSIPPSRLMVVGAWVAGIASLGGMVATVLIALDKVRTEHGLDTFRTHWLVEDNWIGFLLSVVVITLVGISAGVIGWFQRRNEQREIKQLQAKYSEGHHG